MPYLLRVQVNTGAEYYEGDGIEYLGLPGHDHPDFNIAELFPATNDFIAAALASSPQARVVVHCKVRIGSRVCTIPIVWPAPSHQSF